MLAVMSTASRLFGADAMFKGAFSTPYDFG